MSLNDLKRDFLKRLGSGLRNLLNADEIGSDPDTDMKEFIKIHMLIKNNTGKYEFSESKFVTAVGVLDFDLLSQILLQFDQNGVTIQKVLKESKFNPLTMSGREIYLGTLIEQGEIETFLHFIAF
jgi:hypothetical protein